jgi:ribosome-associated toxin RatA of RatAB toxin-antitoxin module
MSKQAFLTIFAALAILAICVAPRFAPAQQTPQMRDLNPADLAKIESGEIILESRTFQDAQGRTRGGGLAIGYIKTGKDKIIDTILKYEDYPQFMPHVKSAEVYTRTDAQVDVNFKIEVAFVKLSYYLTHKVDRANGVITWTLDKTKKNDIAGTDGFWGLKPYKDGTIVYYTVSVDTGRAVPKTIEDYLTKRDLPNIVKTMRKRVEG